MSATPCHESILIIGGGDGLAAREVLKYSDVKKLTVIDIDPAITDFARDNMLMRKLNNDSFRNPKTTVLNADAWKKLEEIQEFFDVIIIDLPDPDNLTLSRLYSKTFYRLIANKLARHGIVVTQATSPLYSHKAFWCIFNTIRSIENPYEINLPNASESKTLYPVAYHTYIPSFGEWGFIIASPMPIFWNKLKLSVPTKFLSNDFLPAMANFPADIDHIETLPNTIDTHPVKAYYEEGWDKWTL
jgi:spermidine synthase